MRVFSFIIFIFFIHAHALPTHTINIVRHYQTRDDFLVAEFLKQQNFIIALAFISMYMSSILLREFAGPNVRKMKNENIVRKF